MPDRLHVAQERTRTSMAFQPLDPESSVSTNSTTWALPLDAPAGGLQWEGDSFIRSGPGRQAEAPASQPVTSAVPTRPAPEPSLHSRARASARIARPWFHRASLEETGRGLASLAPALGLRIVRRTALGPSPSGTGTGTVQKRFWGRRGSLVRSPRASSARRASARSNVIGDPTKGAAPSALDRGEPRCGPTCPLRRHAPEGRLSRV